jgi:uncharacterized membrane protein
VSVVANNLFYNKNMVNTYRYGNVMEGQHYLSNMRTFGIRLTYNINNFRDIFRSNDSNSSVRGRLGTGAELNE